MKNRDLLLVLVQKKCPCSGMSNEAEIRKQMGLRKIISFISYSTYVCLHQIVYGKGINIYLQVGGKRKSGADSSATEKKSRISRYDNNINAIVTKRFFFTLAKKRSLHVRGNIRSRARFFSIRTDQQTNSFLFSQALSDLDKRSNGDRRSEIRVTMHIY